MRPNFNLMKATLTGALGGLLFGFDTVVISGAIDALVQLYHLSPQGKGWTVAIALIGTVVGALGAGVSRAEAGRPRNPAHHRRPLCRLRRRLRAGLELAFAHGLSLHRRAGHRRFVGAGPGLHRRACPGQVARPAGRRIPVQRGLRHSCWPTPPTTSSATLHLGAAEWRWQVGVAAMPAIGFPGAALRHSAQPALVGLKESHRRSPRRAQADGRAGPRRRSWPTSAPPWPRNTPRRTSRSSAGSTATRCSSPSPSAHSTSWPASTPFSITSTTSLLAAGFSQISGDQQAIAIGFTNLIFTMVGMCVDRQAGPQDAAADRRGGHGQSAWPAVAWLFATNSHPGALVWLLDHLHRVLRALAGRGHLGLHRRSLSQLSPLQGPGRGQRQPLDHEHHHRAGVSGAGGEPSGAARRSSSSPS